METDTPGKSRLATILIITGVGLLVLVIIGVGVVFIIKRNLDSAAAPTVTMPLEKNTQVVMGSIGGKYPFPMYPNTQQEAAPGGKAVPAGGVGLTAPGAAGDVFAWYQTQLPGASWQPGQVTSTGPATFSQQFTASDGGLWLLQCYPSGDSVTSVVFYPLAPAQAAAPTPAETVPTPIAAVSATEPTPPVEATPTTTVPTPTAALPTTEPPASAAADQPAGGLKVNLSAAPALVYGGSPNRIEYTLDVAGSGPFTATLTAPPAILISAKNLPEHVAYDAGSGAWVWAANAPAQLKLSGVTDMLAEPGQAALKVVVKAPGQQPVIQVAIITIESY